MDRQAVFAVLAILAAASCFSTVAGQKSKISVSVLYESLCPDSIYFITRELAPSYNDVKDHVNIEFVPFGKASWVVGDDKTPTEFTCQHGPNECRGNRAQACALREIAASVRPEEQQQKMVDVVNCVMANRNPASAVPQCAEKSGLSAQSIESIESCSRSNLGNELLIAQGERTNALQSPLSFVPTVIVNGEKNQYAFRNFKAAICQAIPVGEKPNSCAQSN